MSDITFYAQDEKRELTYLSLEHGFRVVRLTLSNTSAVQLTPNEARKLADDLRRRAQLVEELSPDLIR